MMRTATVRNFLVALAVATALAGGALAGGPLPVLGPLECGSSPGSSAWTPPADSPVLRAAMSRFDADGDGRLTLPDWGRYVRFVSQAPLDPDGDGSVSLSEFAISLATVAQDVQASDETVIFATLSQGASLASRGEFAEAVRKFREVLGRAPGNGLALLGLGRSLEGSGDVESALDAYRQTVHSEPNLAVGWLSLALLELSRADPAGREHLWRGLRLLADSARLAARVSEGAAAGETGFARELSAHWSVADEVVSRLARLAPDLAREAGAWLSRDLGPRLVPAPGPPGYCQMAWLVASGRAASLLEQLDSVPPGSGGGWQPALARHGALTCLRRFDEASRWLDEARRQGAPEPLVSILTAANRLDLGLRKEAVRLLDELALAPLTQLQCEEVAWQLAYRKEPALARPWLQRAGRQRLDRLLVPLALQAERAGTPEFARRAVSGRGGLLLGDTPGLAVAAAICLRLDLLPQARELVDQVIRAMPDCLDALEVQAELAARNGNWSASLAALRRALELSPGGSERKAALSVRAEEAERRLSGPPRSTTR
jgi:tetratricopeptide (TPR) repeat protein